MTILHVTDFHFHQPWFDWLLHRAPAHDLVVMSGDLLDLSHPTPQREQIAWVSDWLNEFPRPLAVASGIHDLEWDPATERWLPAYWLRDIANPLVHTDGAHVALNGLTLLTIGATTRPKGGEADAWVVHGPPSRTLVATRADGTDAGDPHLPASLRRYAPRLVLSGRVHAPRHWCDHRDGTLFLNPGRAPNELFPNHILLRTDDLNALLVSANRVEMRPGLRPAGQPANPVEPVMPAVA